MINGLGVLGWGVGGIEAEAAMLGQPVSMLIPRVVGFQLTGALPEGSTATDLVLTVTEILRRHGVVGKFVEFYGDGVATVPLANRATIGNMSPEYGSTCAIFPIDDETLRYLELTGRSPERIALVEAYAKEQGLWHDPSHQAGLLRTAQPGPVHRRAVARRPRPPAGSGAPGRGAGVVPGGRCRRSWGKRARGRAPTNPTPVTLDDGTRFDLDHGHVVIAAITSCTNTSNPSVMVAAGLAGPSRRREGPDGPALGEDHPGPGLKGGHGLLRAGRAHPLPREAGLRPGGVRLHHVHRQQRAAPPAHLRGGGGRGPGGGGGPVGQPQLRGPHQPRRPHELPGLPAARRRLRPGRLHGRRHRQRPARYGDRRPAGLPPRHLAVARRGGRRSWGRSIESKMFTSSYDSVYDGDERWQHLDVPTGDAYEWDPTLDLRAQTPVLRGHDHDTGAPRGHPWRPGAGPIGRQHHHRPHLTRRQHPAGRPGRADG